MADLTFSLFFKPTRPSPPLHLSIEKKFEVWRHGNRIEDVWKGPIAKIPSLMIGKMVFGGVELDLALFFIKDHLFEEKKVL